MEHLLKYFGTKTKVPNVVKQEILQLTPFVPENAGIKQRLWHIKHATTSIPLCKMCSNTVNWSNSKGYLTYCSKKCLAGDSDVKRKRSQTMKKKYGVEHASQSHMVKEKVKQTCLTRYGTNNVRQVEEIKQKSLRVKEHKYGSANNNLKHKQTLNQRYGVDHISQIPFVQEKIRQTNLERYGVEYAIEHATVQEKIRQTNLERYGVEYPFQSIQIQQTVKRRLKEIYGVDSLFKDPVFQERIKQHNLKQHGVEYPFQNPQLQQNARNVTIQKYNGSFAQSKISRESLARLRSKEWMYEQHVTQQKSLLEISIELNVNDTTVGRYLHEHGIETHFYSNGFICKKWFDNDPSRKNTKSTFYVVKLYNEEEEFLKIGITTKSNFANRSKSIPYFHDTILEIPMTLYESYTLEQYLLRELKYFKYTPKCSFGGQFECMVLDGLEAIVHILEGTDNGN